MEPNPDRFAGVLQALSQECSVKINASRNNNMKPILPKDKLDAIHSGGISSTGEHHVIQDTSKNPMDIINKKISAIVNK